MPAMTTLTDQNLGVRKIQIVLGYSKGKMSEKGNINYTGSAKKTDAEDDKTRGSGNLLNPLRVNASTYKRYIHRVEQI